MHTLPHSTRVPAAIALGGNLGDVERTFKRALSLLERTPGLTVLRRSDWIETEPVGTPIGSPKFLNGAVTLETTLSPAELLRVCLELEQHFGRDRSTEGPKGPRLLDLDVLLFGNFAIAEADLVVPHPRMHERRFVLEPLAQIAPDWPVPGRNTTVAKLLKALDEVVER